MNLSTWTAGLVAAGFLPLTLDPSGERTTLWSDLDGDGHEDLVVRSAGDLRLFFADGSGALTEGEPLHALPPTRGVVDALVADVDRDGRDDLFVVSALGQHHLWCFDGAAFVDRGLETGLAVLGPIADARWHDYDGDGDPDLVVTTASGRLRILQNDAGHFTAILRLRASRSTACSIPSRDLFVSDFLGWIGMGTTNPQTDLHVHGGQLTQPSPGC